MNLQSRLAGNIIRSIEDRYAESYRRRLNRGGFFFFFFCKSNYLDLLSCIAKFCCISLVFLASIGRDEINEIITNLQIGGGDNMINRALAFYQVFHL